MDRFCEQRRYDERIAARNSREILGWIAMAVVSYSLFGLNLYLLIVLPMVGIEHSIVGVVLGTFLVVGSTANLMGKFYEDR